MKASFGLAIKIISILWIIVSALVLLFSSDMTMEKWKILSYLSFGYGLPILFANCYFLKSLSQSVSWKEHRLQRFWKGLLGSLFVSLIMVGLVNFVQWIVIWGADFSTLFSERNMVFYLITLVLTAVISTCLHLRLLIQYKD